MKNTLKKYVPRIDETLIEEIYKDYPNPIIKRTNFLSLNRTYKLEFNKSEYIPSEYKHRVMVPFPLDSKLSEYNGSLLENNYYHYHKEFTYHKNNNDLYINFLRIKGEYKILINGEIVKTGIDDINVRVNISSVIYDGVNKLDICIKLLDKTNFGISGHVYLDESGRKIIKDVKTKINYKNKSIEFFIDSSLESGKITIYTPLKDQQEIEYTDNYANITLKDFIEYTINEPYFYQYKVNNSSDTYSGIFTLNEFSIDNVDNINYLLMNKKPLPLYGVVDNTYYPYGNNMYPSNEFVKTHLSEIKNIGFNTLFLDRDIELPYFYYTSLLKGILIANKLIITDIDKFKSTIYYLSKFPNNYLFVIDNKSSYSDKDIYELSKEIVLDKLVCVGDYKDIDLFNNKQIKQINKASIILPFKTKHTLKDFTKFMEKDYIKYSLKGMVGFYYSSFKGDNPLSTTDNLIRLSSQKEIKNILKN